MDILNFGKNLNEIFIGIDRELSPLLHLLVNCHYIVIEKQPFKNANVYRTTDRIISYIFDKIKNQGVRGVIIEIDPKIKTDWIGGPKNKKEFGGESIKKWSVQKAQEILEEREDRFSLRIIKNALYKPKQDLSDVVCYEYAWWSFLTTKKEIPKINFSDFKNEY